MMKKEGNKYDKILKEGIEEGFLALSKQFLGFEIKNYKKLTPKLQTTLEKEVDFLALVETATGKEFILHLEFQTENDPNMLYRMAEYHGILSKKYRKPIKAVVLYLGNSKATMQTKLTDNEVFTGFELLDVRQWSYQKILELDSPEAMVWAILANFENEPQEKVLRSILERVKQLSNNTTTSQKFVKQLLMFSQLRKLDTSLQKIVDAMPITIDLRENAVVKAAIAKEKEKLRKAHVEQKQQAIQKMLLTDSLSLEQIADFMSLFGGRCQKNTSKNENIIFAKPTKSIKQLFIFILNILMQPPLSPKTNDL